MKTLAKPNMVKNLIRWKLKKMHPNLGPDLIQWWRCNIAITWPKFGQNIF